MDSITAILDGNIYRVEENFSSQTTVDSDSEFDSIYNTLSDDSDLDAIFEWASEQTGVDVNLIKAVAQAESGFDTNAVSSGGAMGITEYLIRLMQVRTYLEAQRFYRGCWTDMMAI